MIVRVPEFLIRVSFIHSPSRTPLASSLNLRNGNNFDWALRTLLTMLMQYQVSMVTPVPVHCCGPVIDWRRQAYAPRASVGVIGQPCGADPPVSCLNSRPAG